MKTASYAAHLADATGPGEPIPAVHAATGASAVRGGGIRADVARRANRISHRGTELSVITDAALAAVPGASYVSITRAADDGDVHGHAANDPVVDSLVTFQNRTRQGPYTVARERRTVTVGDAGRDDRWPRFAADAATVGIAGILTTGVPTDDGALAALTLYATVPDAFTHADEATADVFAGRAGRPLADRVERCRVADLVSAHGVVGRATGMLIGRHDISPSGACELLADTAAHTGRTITAIAGDLVHTADPDGQYGNRDTESAVATVAEAHDDLLGAADPAAALRETVAPSAARQTEG